MLHTSLRTNTSGRPLLEGRLFGFIAGSSSRMGAVSALLSRVDRERNVHPWSPVGLGEYLLILCQLPLVVLKVALPQTGFSW